MEEEEIALKKQLEASKDFDERKEIRQKLRKLRQQKLDALEADSSSRGGRRRREERTETRTTTTSDGVTVTEKHTTKTEIVENGDVVKSEEDVVVKKEVEPEPEPEPEPEIEVEEEPEVEQEPEEEEPAPEEDQEEDVGDVPFYMQKNPEDLTENDIGEIDDLEFLETTLNDLPLKFFEVRKHLRGQIRKVKVNRAKQKHGVKDTTTKAKTTAPPKGSQRVEGPQIDIQDKNQLSLLRQQLEEQKRQKEAGGSTITEEKTTITDGSTTTTTKTTTEKHGPGGSSTVTKTTTTRTGTGTGRAGARNIEAELARKKKERMSAKAAAFKNVKDQRNAFKEKLQQNNPKPAGGVKKSFQSPNTAVNALLEWCRRKTRGYGIDLQNYTTSWADGMAMCAIFHYFSPDLVPWETLDPNDRKRNWTLAFEAAYAEGLDPLLELEDVLRSKVPEPKSLITYVHSIYQHFHDKTEKAKLEKEQAAG